MARGADSLAMSQPQHEDAHDKADERAQKPQTKSVAAGVCAHLPVFGAFNDLGLSARDVARLSGVSAPTISKWRSGKARIPGDRLAFLTLVLAHLLDEVDLLDRAERGCCAGRGCQDTHDGGDGEKISRSGPVGAARAALSMQDVLNRDLPARDVYGGAQRFRLWWDSHAPSKLTELSFRPQTKTDILQTLKNMRTRT